MFVGDSLSLNQWQSLTCMLHKAVPGANYTLARTGGVSTFRFPVWLFSLSTCNLERANLVMKKILKTMKKKNYSGDDKNRTIFFGLKKKYISIIGEKNEIIQKEICTKTVYHKRKWYYTKTNSYSFTHTTIQQKSWFEIMILNLEIVLFLGMRAKLYVLICVWQLHYS